MRRAPLILVLALLGGCTTMQSGWPLYSALDFWEASVEGSTAERDALWAQAQAQDSEWRIALLQSLPDYHRYNPMAARRGLEAAVKVDPHDDVAAIARIRLAELRNGHACRARSAELQERLDRIIAIEKGLEQDAR
ncbi:MAG: hypothetical protein ACPHN2_00445 [Sinimarinibacterium flocculans]|uniref:hypothetical protein n=1 Tax=Sinimarinibacterium flocculans TaxID=985250 RepID=UPI003C40A671